MLEPFFSVSFLPPSLSSSYIRATVVEAELRSIAEEQHGNVDKLVDLVKENEAILAEMRVCQITYISYFAMLVSFHSHIPFRII